MTAAPPTVSLAYGRGAIDVPLQDGALVITPQDDPALEDPSARLREALRDPLGVPPLREQVRRVCYLPEGPQTIPYLAG